MCENSQGCLIWHPIAARVCISVDAQLNHPQIVMSSAFNKITGFINLKYTMIWISIIYSFNKECRFNIDKESIYSLIMANI